jgi:hypothetical protein
MYIGRYIGKDDNLFFLFEEREKKCRYVFCSYLLGKNEIGQKKPGTFMQF